VGCNGPFPEATFPSITPNSEEEFAKTEFFHSLRLVSMFVQMYNSIQTKKQIEKRGERQGEIKRKKEKEQ
jgi:hypothetical protein